MNWLRHELLLTAHFFGGNSNHGAKREIMPKAIHDAKHQIIKKYQRI